MTIEKWGDVRFNNINSKNNNIEQVEKVFNRPTRDGILLRDHILGDLGTQDTILSSWPQEFYLLTARNTVGLAYTWVTELIWDSTTTLDLCDKLNVHHILVINSEVDDHKIFSNQVFLRDLAHGGIHPQLTLVSEVPGARLFRILPLG